MISNGDRREFVVEARGFHGVGHAGRGLYRVGRQLADDQRGALFGVVIDTLLLEPTDDVSSR